MAMAEYTGWCVVMGEAYYDTCSCSGNTCIIVGSPTPVRTDCFYDSEAQGYFCG